MLVVRAEAPGPRAEVRIRRARRRMRQRKQRNQARTRLDAHVDDAGEAERLVAIFRDRFGIHHDQRPLGQRQRGVHGDARRERRRERQIADELRRFEVGDVEYDEAAAAVRQIRAVAHDVGAAVQQGVFGRAAFAARGPLARGATSAKFRADAPDRQCRRSGKCDRRSRRAAPSRARSCRRRSSCDACLCRRSCNGRVDAGFQGRPGPRSESLRRICRCRRRPSRAVCVPST